MCADTRARIPALELSGASKSFGHIDALIGASLSVYPGEVLALVGDNGAGKTTMTLQPWERTFMRPLPDFRC